jgi:hypothetical protein
MIRGNDLDLRQETYLKKENTFILSPFNTGDARNLGVRGKLERKSGRLIVVYELNGPVKNLAIPQLSMKPERKNRLWEETCFELFLSPVDSEAYWEFNLSPSGDWNVFKFSAYRQGMQEEQAFETLPFTVEILTESMQLAVEIDPGKFIPDGKAVNVGISAVIKDVHGERSYWALTHNEIKPDFHRKDGFLIVL